jgi:hypothetical protein
MVVKWYNMFKMIVFLRRLNIWKNLVIIALTDVMTIIPVVSSMWHTKNTYIGNRGKSMKNKKGFSRRKIKKQWLDQARKMSDGWWLNMAYQLYMSKRAYNAVVEQNKNMTTYLSMWLNEYEKYKGFYDDTHKATVNIEDENKQ